MLFSWWLIICIAGGIWLLMWTEQAYIFLLSKVNETKPTIPLNVSDPLQRGPQPNAGQKNTALHVAWLLSASQIASSWVDSSIVYVLKIVGMWTITTFTFSPNPPLPVYITILWKILV